MSSSDEQNVLLDYMYIDGWLLFGMRYNFIFTKVNYLLFIYISYVFDSNAADERLLIETCDHI